MRPSASGASVALDTGWVICYLAANHAIPGKATNPGETILQSLSLDNAEISHRETLIDAHVGRHLKRDAVPEELPEYRELLRIREQVLDLLAQADRLAKAIRMKCGSE
jgi:hypothetical protein